MPPLKVMSIITHDDKLDFIQFSGLIEDLKKIISIEIYDKLFLEVETIFEI
jgi:hypothetical protein